MKYNVNCVEECIAALPEDIHPLLQSIRKTIRIAISEATEKITWLMPTCWYKHNIIHFAAFKKHIGLYPGPKAIENFADRLKGIRQAKEQCNCRIISRFHRI